MANSSVETKVVAEDWWKVSANIAKEIKGLEDILGRSEDFGPNAFRWRYKVARLKKQLEVAECVVNILSVIQRGKIRADLREEFKAEIGRLTVKYRRLVAKDLEADQKDMDEARENMPPCLRSAVMMPEEKGRDE